MVVDEAKSPWISCECYGLVTSSTKPVICFACSRADSILPLITRLFFLQSRLFSKGWPNKDC